MSMLDTRLARLKDIPGGRMAQRLKSEMNYARRVSQALNGRHEALILKAADQMEATAVREGAISDERALEIEGMLLPMQADCKKYRLMLCGHAHIDMNWMWRYDETVQITLDTFSTVLRLMREYPDFTFSQSQASVYRIVEQNDPAMLEEIRRRVAEGRWEVSASTWVEADRNMGSVESVARHHLYTANYLEKLVGTPRVRVDFEPDTFGHHRNTPELLSQAGVKYYYHCRGLQEQTLYRWRAPSGAEVLVYREPFWYNDKIEGDIADYAPEFCEKFGVESAIRVYGVGDHGGGPTRRDINRVLEMRDWPIYATLEFGTYARFFEQAARATKEVPVVDQELNPVFVGCYTSQSRIKKGNRYGERLLGEAEGVNAIAHAEAGAPYRHERFEEGWRNVLFNQFHDILPGSGVPDTREHAMGLYQEAYAVANSARRISMRAIAGKIDTSSVPAATCAEDTSTGAGVGFRVEESVNLAHTEVGQGMTRVFHLFNACAFEREEVTDITVWDWAKDTGKMEVVDLAGNPVEHQIIQQDYNHYWGHNFTRVLVRAKVPAMGYQTLVVRPREDVDAPFAFGYEPRLELDEDWAIENEYLAVECDPAVHHGAMIVTEKATGETWVIDGFHFIQEDSSRGMTAWATGDPLVDQRVEAISMKRTVKGELYNELTATSRLTDRSGLTWKVGLKKGARQVEIGVECHWLEVGDRTLRKVPQLFFRAMADRCDRTEYDYDIPGGVIRREARAHDLPGVRFVAGGRMMLLSDSKYGYRGDVGNMGVTLIRSSYDPDLYPEQGVHQIRLALALTDGETALERTRVAGAFESPLTAVSGERHEGSLPGEKSFVNVVKGSVELLAVKLSQDGKALILRGMELEGDGKDVRVQLGLEAKSARFTDTMEEQAGEEVSLDKGCLRFDARPWGLFAIRVEL